MPFTVYPDAATSALLGTPANTPVPLAAGAMFSAFAPLAPDSGPDPSEFNLQTTFIRISMSLPASATPPQIELEAHNPTAGTTGPSVIISAMSFPGQSLNDGTNPTDAATAYLLPPYSNNVYLLKVVTEISGTTFLMRITNNTAAAHDFVWVVADSDANSQQPWIQVSPTSLAYTALENQTATQTAQSLQINNRGTGSMTVSTITPSIAAPYAVNSGLPAIVAPNPATPLPSIVIGFNAPGTIQTLAATNYTTDGDPGAVTGAGRNNAFSLSANTTGLEVVMMLDDSGSMAATDTTSGSTRLNELQSAAKLFLDDLAAFGAASGTIGVLMFPGTDPNNPTDLASYNLQRATQIPADMTAIKNLINPLVPVDNTPMDYCIQDLFAATAPPYFAVDAASIAHNRRWMLLMSDGKWNVGPDPNTEVSNLGSKNIVVFSAGYGQSGQVDYATLTNLATGSGSAPGGQALQVDLGAGYSALQLANKFKGAIKAGLTSVNSPGDPTSTIFPGQVQQFEMIITKYDTKAVFSINWDTPNLPLSLELLSPACDLITPQAAANTPGLKFNSDSRYQMYVVDGSYLRNDANPTSPRFGVWRMVVTYNNPILEAAAVPAAVNLIGQPFSYDVLTESSLRLDVSLDQSVYYAGDTIGVTAKLTANGLPVTGAAVQLSVTAPSQSMDNWLAGIPISAAEYAAAARALAGKDASAIYIKAFAVQTKGITFVNVPVQTTIPMSDPTNSGIYTATVNQTTIPDGHTLYVTATGTTSDGVAFRRDRSVEVRVVVRPDPVFTIFNIQYDPFTSSTAPVTGTITVTPRDRFGNVVLIDPANSKYLALQATGATLGQALTTAFDGSYATTLSYAPGARPTISLTAGGVTVSNHVPVPPADQLEYVDEVITFVPGMAAAAGANQHGNPGDVLGDIRQKAANLFVSLGAYGSITVGIKGQVILARADDDVTVFVEPDINLRSYIVEASPAGSASGWVKLGQSDGYSASFSLKAAHLTAASAIRITDASGITRDASHSPSPTPGVSIRGVGVASSASAVNVIGGYERLFIGFFSNGGVASVANFPSRFISKIDGYQYKQSEVSYEYFLHSTRKPAQGFVQGQLTPPAPANANSGAGDLLYMLWDVDDATGTVSLTTSFYVDGKQETPTNDGCVKVYAVCQRSSA